MPSFDLKEDSEVVFWLEKSEEAPSDCDSKLQTEDERCLVHPVSLCLVSETEDPPATWNADRTCRTIGLV